MLNRCEFIGNLGRDPETRYLPDGTAVCNFSIAVNESYKDRNGEKQTKTEWVRMVAWAKLAEICQEYLTKGKQIYAAGKYQTRSWEKDGETKYMTEVRLDKMVMLGGGQKQESRSRNVIEEDYVDDDSDIPF